MEKLQAKAQSQTKRSLSLESELKEKESRLMAQIVEREKAMSEKVEELQSARNDLFAHQNELEALGVREQAFITRVKQLEGEKGSLQSRLNDRMSEIERLTKAQRTAMESEREMNTQLQLMSASKNHEKNRREIESQEARKREKELSKELKISHEKHVELQREFEKAVKRVEEECNRSYQSGLLGKERVAEELRGEIAKREAVLREIEVVSKRLHGSILGSEAPIIELHRENQDRFESLPALLSMLSSAIEARNGSDEEMRNEREQREREGMREREQKKEKERKELVQKMESARLQMSGLKEKVSLGEKRASGLESQVEALKQRLILAKEGKERAEERAKVERVSIFFFFFSFSLSPSLTYFPSFLFISFSIQARLLSTSCFCLLASSKAHSLALKSQSLSISNERFLSLTHTLSLSLSLPTHPHTKYIRRSSRAN